MDAEDEANAGRLILVSGMTGRRRRINRFRVAAAVLVIPSGAAIIVFTERAIRVFTTVELNFVACVFDVLIVTCHSRSDSLSKNRVHCLEVVADAIICVLPLTSYARDGGTAYPGARVAGRKSPSYLSGVLYLDR